MPTAKLFRHGGSQAVRLPKAFRFEGAEVLIDRRGDEVVLRPKPDLATFGDLVRHLRARFPDAGDFPDIERPKRYERPIPNLD
ncbi:MAG: AbrB/MazE/SpoVT family DNA-binding domain-containing protein [Verrucomicrobiae bacterium]|nr:AbrB/MazE/SpoVT family DNA-binding domain-containing protein [Verrucomicrobiae bacterium]